MRGFFLGYFSQLLLINKKINYKEAIELKKSKTFL